MGGDSEAWNEGKVKKNRIPENLEHKLIKGAALSLTQPSYLYCVSPLLVRTASGSRLMNVYVSIKHVGRLLFDLACFWFVRVYITFAMLYREL